MKTIILIILATFSFSSCNAQSDAIQKAKQELADTKVKLDEANSNILKVQTSLDSIKYYYDSLIVSYSHSISDMKNQIEGYKIMIANCPDSSLIKDMRLQLHALEAQIANMRIVEQNSYNLMLEFKDIWDRWSKLYDSTHITP